MHQTTHDGDDDAGKSDAVGAAIAAAAAFPSGEPDMKEEDSFLFVSLASQCRKLGPIITSLAPLDASEPR